MPFRPRAEIRIELEPDEAPPGDSVEVAIRVVPGDDLELVEGRIDLVYENEYTYRTRRYSYLTKLSSVRDETVTDVVVEESARFLEAGALVADTPYEDAVTLTVPESAAPSAEGEITSVRWWAIATLVRQRGRDLRGYAELTVLSEAGQELGPAVVATHRDCELSFELDRDDFGPGDIVEGTLVATPIRACAVREVRVELIRHEEVPRDEGNAVDVTEDEATLAEGVSLSPGLPHEWPFRLDLPEIVVPSLRSDQSRVTCSWQGSARGDCARTIESHCRSMFTAHRRRIAA